MTAENLLTRLEAVRQTGPNKWLARCPGHPDRSPSLSICEADDGRVLMHCFVGCSNDDILTAIGLSWKDLYPDKWREAEARGIAHGHKRRQKLLSEITQAEYARHVVAIAQADVEAGKVLSLQDRATVDLALAILRGGGQ